MSQIYEKNQITKRYKSRNSKFVQAILISYFALIAVMYVIVLASKRFLDSNNEVSKVTIYSNYILIILVVIAVLALIAIVINVAIKIIKVKSIKIYLRTLRVEKKIKKGLLNESTVNAMRDTDFIEVPQVQCFARDIARFEIHVERLFNMNDINKVSDIVSKAFIGKLAAFAVTEKFELDNHSKFIFVAENVMQKLQFKPAQLSDFKQEKAVIKLQESVTVNLSKTPHMLLAGKSGSGKSTQIMSIVLQLFAQQAEVKFIDPKFEFSAFDTFLQKDEIARNADDVLKLMSSVVAEIESRQEIVKTFTQAEEKMGLTGYDANLSLQVVIIDELADLVATFDSKQKKEFYNYLTKIMMTGRSVLVELILCTQFANVDVIPNSIRSQCSTKILLGSSTVELQRMVFGSGNKEVSEDVAQYEGYYLVDGQTKQPKRFFVTNLHEHNMNRLEVFETLYRTKLTKLD